MAKRQTAHAATLRSARVLADACRPPANFYTPILPARRGLTERASSSPPQETGEIRNLCITPEGCDCTVTDGCGAAL
jgi:hypothetical protein